MGAARLDLTKKNGLEINQGYDYGPVRFKVRESDFEQLTLEIDTVGAVGDVFSLVLFGSNSDRPEVITTLTHTVTSTDTAATIAEDFVEQLNELVVEYDIPSGGTDVYRFTATRAAGVVTFSPDEVGFHLDATESTTGTAAATLTVVVEVLVDLTGATVEASGKLEASDTTKLFFWSNDPGSEFSLADALRGVIDLDVPAATTATYEWDACSWEMSVETPTDSRKRIYFTGCAENRLTLQ